MTAKPKPRTARPPRPSPRANRSIGAPSPAQIREKLKPLQQPPMTSEKGRRGAGSERRPTGASGRPGEELLRSRRKLERGLLGAHAATAPRLRTDRRGGDRGSRTASDGRGRRRLPRGARGHCLGAMAAYCGAGRYIFGLVGEIAACNRYVEIADGCGITSGGSLPPE
jgi:hypothetical protein